MFQGRPLRYPLKSGSYTDTLPPDVDIDNLDDQYLAQLLLEDAERAKERVAELGVLGYL